MRIIKKQLVFSLSLFTPLNVWANPEIENVVISGTRIETQEEELAENIALLTKEELQLLQAAHPSESLNRVGGVWISRGSGQEHLSAIRSPVFTGAGACGAFLMMENGIPLRAKGFCNVNQLLESHYEMANRIEVFRGPHSSVYGSNALFGGMDIRLPSVKESERYIKVLSDGELSLSVNNYNENSDSNIAAHTTLVKREGWRDGSSVDQQKLNLQHNHENGNFSANSTLGINNLEQETAGFIQGKDSYKDSSIAKSNPNPEAYRDALSLRLNSQLHWQLNNSELHLTPYFRRSEMEFLMHFLPWQPVEKNQHWSLGTHLLWRKPLSNTLNIYSGVDWEYSSGKLNETQYQDAPFAQLNFPVGTHYDYSIEATNLGAFAGLSWQATEQWRTDMSARSDSSQYQYNNRLSPGSACTEEASACRFYRPEDREDTFFDVSWRLSTLYTFNRHLRVFASSSNGHQAPQTTELYRLQNGQNKSDIDSVALNAQELGLKYYSDNFTAEVSLFSMLRKNGIYQNSERFQVDGSESSHKGIEYEISLNINEALRASVSSTYAEHKYTNNPNLLGTESLIKNNAIDTAPRRTHNFRLNHRYRDRLNTELEIRVMGDYYLDPENSASYSGHSLANLRSTYAVNSKLKLSAHILNLFNKKYAERADISFGEERYFPGRDRFFKFGLIYSFGVK